MFKRAAAMRFAVAILISLVCTCCAADTLTAPQAEQLLSPDGSSTWASQDQILKTAHDKALEIYRSDDSIESLRQYDLAAKAYLDHGFTRYRAYTTVKQDPPDELVSSLNQRLATLMDVADEYIKQGSRPMATGIASNVIHNYSDLPVMGPAQRRAEAVLLRYRYRSDY